MAKSYKETDIIRLRHMHDAIRESLSFLQGKKKSDLRENRMLALAIIKEIEMIGEAARKISDDFKKKHHDIPWQHMVATRNRLIHGYFDIDVDIVWQTVTVDLKEIDQQIKSILKNK